MALQDQGVPISLNDLHVEAGGSSGTTCSLNDADIRDIIGKASGATNSLFEYYGQSSEEVLTSAGTINGQAQRQEITASSFISSGGTLRIPSNMWVWSDSTSTAALTIDIPCTIINEGKIIGKGGRGGSGLRIKSGSHPPTASAYNSGYSTSTLGSGEDGGPAIKINSGVSGVTITNSSGAFIAGGGGGGGASGVEPMNTFAGGGGGAGGGDGGSADLRYSVDWHGYGGILNHKGSNFNMSSTRVESYTLGGEAGGPAFGSAGEDQRSPSGCGGGRILAGSRVTPSYGGGYGGAGGEAGGTGNSYGYSGAGGGGGGWGSAGGNGYRGTFASASHQCQGGAGGKAVEDSGVSYTLSNSGTIYGST